jgi:hypothetical protein
MIKESEATKSHCNLCGRETKHIVLATRVVITDEDEGEEYGPLRWEDTYELLECAGCESVSMKHTNWFVQGDAVEVSIYPPPVKRRRPHWFNEIPRPVSTLLQQVYQALDGNSRSLALMGARAVLDMVLVEVAGDKGAFSAKLDELEKKGFIGSKNKEVLDAALDAGSAASHRGYMPSINDINAVMDIVENLLQTIYHLKTLADSLKKTTPVRPAKK